MGKRELFIALAFVAVGVLAYQLTAPPAERTNRGFSLSNFWSRARRGMRANIFQATSSAHWRDPRETDARELRLDGLAGRVAIVGEAREDMTYELAVESTGPDRETATGYAKQVTLRSDDLGTALALHVSYPRAARQAAVLTLHVPDRLGVFLADVNGLDVAHVASAHLDNVIGDWHGRPCRRRAQRQPPERMRSGRLTWGRSRWACSGRGRRSSGWRAGWARPARRRVPHRRFERLRGDRRVADGHHHREPGRSRAHQRQRRPRDPHTAGRGLEEWTCGTRKLTRSSRAPCR